MINPSTSSLIVHIVEKEQMEDAVFFQQITLQVLQVLVPTLAGTIITLVTYRHIYLLDMVVILFVLFLLCKVKYDHKSDVIKKTNKKSIIGNIREIFSQSYSYIDRRAMIIFLGCASVINILGAAFVLSMQVYVVNENIDKILVGILFASSPLGGLIGSFIAKKNGLTDIKIYKSMIYVFLMGLFNLFMGIVSFHNHTICFIFCYFISGIFFGLSNVHFGIFYKKYIPKEIQGRFFGMLNSILMIATPVGNIINGILLKIIDASMSITILGILTCLAGLLFVFMTKGMVWHCEGESKNE